MATDNRFSLICFICIYILLIFSWFRVSKSQSTPAVFVLGDSLVDVGNNNYLLASVARANFIHHGIDFPNKRPTGRFSNGKNFADFFAEKVGLPTSPPYLSLSTKNISSLMTGVSFASSGAGILDGSDERMGQSIPLTKQVSNYESIHETIKQDMPGSENYFAKSLFLVVIGSNDLYDYFENLDLQATSTTQQFVDDLASKFKVLLKRMYDSGARKYVVTGTGGIGCAPAVRANNDDEPEECVEQLNSLSKMYNVALKSMLEELKSELAGMSYSYLDVYTIMDKMLRSPATYGFKEIKEACCGMGKLKAKLPCLPFSTCCSNRRDHLFWDLYHPTEAAVRIVTDDAFNLQSEYSYPINVNQLIRA